VSHTLGSRILAVGTTEANAASTWPLVITPGVRLAAVITRKTNLLTLGLGNGAASFGCSVFASNYTVGHDVAVFCLFVCLVERKK